MLILGVAKGDREECFDAETASELARAVGLQGGKAWVAKLSLEERSQIAFQTARVRGHMSDDDSHG